MTFSLRQEVHSPDRITLHVHGRLDASTFGQFDTEAAEILADAADGTTVVLDLGALDYISSAGLRSFARIRKSMRARNGNTLLLNLQPQVRKVFEIVKAVPVSEIFVSAQELDDYLDKIQRQMTSQSEGLD